MSPQEKSDVYKGSHLLLTQSLVKITIHSERTKVENYLSKVGVKKTDWSLTDWDKESIDSRANLYCALLKYHLTTFD